MTDRVMTERVMAGRAPTTAVRDVNALPAAGGSPGRPVGRRVDSTPVRCCVCGRRGVLDSAGACALCAGTDAAGVAWSYAGSVRVQQRWWQVAWPLLAVTGPGAVGLGVWAATGDPVTTMGTTLAAGAATMTAEHLAVVTSRRGGGNRQRLLVAAAALGGAGMWGLGTLSPAATMVLGGAALVAVLREQWRPSTGPRRSPTSPAAALPAPTRPAGGRSDRGVWGWSCPECGLDSTPVGTSAEAAGLAGAHDGIHHGTRATAWLWTGTPPTGSVPTGSHPARRSGWAA